MSSEVPNAGNLPIQLAPLPQPAPLIVKCATGLPRIDTAAELLTDSTLTEPGQIVHGILHKGTKAVIASTSKAGKTWLLLDLAIAVSEGQKFLKWDTTASKVLFVNFEIPKVFMRERIRHLKIKKQQLTENTQELALNNLHIWTLRGLTGDFDNLLERMIDNIRESKFDLVILDPIYKGMAGKDENASQTVGELCHNIEVLCVETGAAVVYAHHFSKGNLAHKNVLDRMSGSGVFARDADTIVGLTPHKEEDCYTVDVTLRNFAAQPSFVVEFDFPVMKLRPTLKADDLKGRGGRPALTDDEALLSLLPDEGLTFTDWKELAKAQSIPESSFKRRRKYLFDNDLIEYFPGTERWRRVQEG